MQRTLQQLVTGVVAATLAVGLAVPLGAQQEQDQTEIVELIRVDVAPAEHMAFEEGVKAHHQTLRAQDVDYPVHIWGIVTGKHSDSYYVLIPGPTWADFGESSAEDPEAVRQSLDEHVLPHVSGTHAGFWRSHPDLSYEPGEEGEGPPELTTVTFFHLEAGETEAFTNAVKRFKNAAEQADYREADWSIYELEYGGGPVWAASSGEQSWADLADPEKTLGEVFEEQTSEFELEALGDQFDRAIAHAHGEILDYREDLSYTPESGQ